MIGVLGHDKLQSKTAVGGNKYMDELIKVTYDNDRPVVSARELHEFLEVETNCKVK